MKFRSEIVLFVRFLMVTNMTVSTSSLREIFSVWRKSLLPYLFLSIAYMCIGIIQSLWCSPICVYILQDFYGSHLQV